MIVGLTLKDEEAAFFHLLKADIHLSFEAPGPVKVEWECLLPEEQRLVRQGVFSGVLATDVLLPADPVFVSTPTVQKVVVTKESGLGKERQRYLVGVLKLVAKDVALEVDKISDIMEVEFMLSAEKRGKKRKGVIAFLGEKMKAIAIEREKEIIRAVSNHPMMARSKVDLSEEIDPDSIEVAVINFQ